MAEWPKLHCVEHSGNPDDGEHFRHIEVIPAELGRELYEALRPFVEAMAPTRAASKKRQVIAPSPERLLEVIARYEREVNPHADRMQGGSIGA